MLQAVDVGLGMGWVRLLVCGRWVWVCGHLCACVCVFTFYDVCYMNWQKRDKWIPKLPGGSWEHNQQRKRVNYSCSKKKL